MKRNLSIVGVALILLVSACSPQAAPTMNSQDVQHTAEAAAFTVVAQTQKAQPTNTLLPPTATVTLTPMPTLTAIPNLTANPTLATSSANRPPNDRRNPAAPSISTSVQTSRPTSVSVDTSGSSADDCNKPLTSWKGPTATFTIKNETKPQGDIVLSLYVVTPQGECGYLTDVSHGPAGLYSAGAFVNGKKNFKVFGGFHIQEGSWKITVRNDKIIAMGSCYPNC